jgi:hypothetical protein
MKLRAAFLVFFASLAHGATATNAPIDLTIPLAPEPATDAEVFDESVIFAPNFGVNQNDPALSDLFSKAGLSNLCFPTTLAEDLIFLKGFSNPKFASLQLAGTSQDGKTVDPNALIRQLAKDCKTNAETGTFDFDGLNCALALAGNAQLISPFDQSPAGLNPPLPIETRQVKIEDIRNTLKRGVPAILEVAWFKFDAPTRTWIRDSGHYVGVYGYDYDNSWGENQIQLKIINPEMNYGTSRQYAQFDTVTIERVSPQPGIIYPANRPFIATGSGFGGSTDRGFVGTLLTVDPATAPGMIGQ